MFLLYQITNNIVKKPVFVNNGQHKINNNDLLIKALK